ncbi:MAG: type II secretion system protein, partial [Phycisphaerae bacterium]|nr:type II secretion system protein [Phycisphaerae bacterium]
MNRTAPNIAAETGRSSHRRSAFTLIELLVVIFILGILVTLVVSISGYILDKANRDQTLANQKVILTAIGAYHDIAGDYPPDTDADLDPGIPLTLEERTGWVLLYYLKGDKAAGAGNDALARRIQDATGKSLLNLPTDAFGGESVDGFRDAYGQ